MGSLYDYLGSNQDSVYPLLHKYVQLEKPFVSASEIKAVFIDYCTADNSNTQIDSSLANTIRLAQEASIQAPWIYLALRVSRDEWNYLRFHLEAMEYEEITAQQYLGFKEQIVSSNVAADWVLDFDLSHFIPIVPCAENEDDLGKGIKYINRYLSERDKNELRQNHTKLLTYLRELSHQGVSLMLNQRITDLESLQTSLRFADEYLAGQGQELPWKKISFQLQAFGFEAGWGSTVVRVRQTIQLLKEFLEQGNPQVLEQFISRIPLLFDILIVAPHGYLGQSAVLGLPDTGGQVIYILDQVRSLEKELRQKIHNAGVEIEPNIIVATRLLPNSQNTTCNQREERVIGTNNAKIMRIPFRNKQGAIITEWKSRFEGWPCLERFAAELKRESLAWFGSKPNQVIGHCSDGNLVASLIARDLDIMQCNIAYSLDQSRYPFSDIFWAELDDRYHFSCQYTADLLSMNTADMILIGTAQEITGRDVTPGQYERFKTFTLPGLYRVTNGLNIKHPKFNVVPPGVNSEVFFPYSDLNKRLQGLEEEITSLLYGDSDRTSRGSFEDCNKRVIFTMSRFDYAKNISGLVEWFGKHETLQQQANLLIVGGRIDLAESTMSEEQEEIRKIHRLMDKYALDGKVRWVGRQLERNLCGELYRFISDMQGVFVQPALFESFSLSIIEAMSCGLPVFATRYGGAQETLVDGVSGYLIDPLEAEGGSEIISRFFAQCEKDPQYWQQISDAAINRVQGHYSWSKHAKTFVELTQLYQYWSNVADFDSSSELQYLNLFYGLQFRPLAEAMEEQAAANA